MKIKSIKIKNFRGYKNETVIDFDNLTVIVGKNDIGKSTILEALDIFFNDGIGVTKIDKTDLNIHSAQDEENEIMICVCFSELPQTIIIDTTFQTTLASEYMLNANDLLEVVKKYKNGGKPSVFIRAVHPTNTECKELLLMKNAELKRLLAEQNISCSNQSINTLIRKAIWNHHVNNLDLQIIDIDASKEDAKKYGISYLYIYLFILYSSQTVKIVMGTVKFKIH